MARMPSGQPRSVPDPEGDAYDKMLLLERRKREGVPQSVGHPGFAESLIPVWGSGREAVADFQEGDYAGAALNGALAASDLFLVGAVGKVAAKTAMKGATKAGQSYAWKAVRKQLGDEGYLQPYQHGHHWLIPQNGWGKAVPDSIKNRAWNIKPMPSAEVHGRVHGTYKGKPQYNPVEAYVRGTPTTAKVATGTAVGHPLTGAKAEAEKRRP